MVLSLALDPTPHRGVYRDGRRLLTRNLVPGTSVYGERLVPAGREEFRAWNPRRSKLAALLLLDDRPFPPAGDASVLYLGAGAGTTASHLSDIVPDGTIYAVEVAPRAFEKLLRLAEARSNLVPLLEDAREPARYRDLVGPVDLLYQDVAQRDQAHILLANFPSLKEDGLAILMIKARSVDVTAAPKTVFRRVRSALRAARLRVDAPIPLDPYQKDHAALLVRP